VKFVEGISEGGCDVSSRLTIQPLCLDQPGTSGGIPERAPEVPSGLGVVVGDIPTGRVTADHGQPSEPRVVHDHIRLGQHQIIAIACVGIRIRIRKMKHAETPQRGETMGRSSCGGELSPGWGPSEMISNRRSNANGKVLVKGVGKHLLPTAQAWAFGRPSPPVPAPGTGNRHTDLLCHLIPGQALVTQLHDLLR
jgi:hypothetical protein